MTLGVVEVPGLLKNVFLKSFHQLHLQLKHGFLLLLLMKSTGFYFQTWISYNPMNTECGMSLAF
jgi:hypothetical protein